MAEVSPATFKNIVQEVYAGNSRGVDGSRLPEYEMEERWDQEYWTKKRYKSVRLEMFNKFSRHIIIFFKQGEAEFCLGDRDGHYHSKKMDIADIREFAQVLNAAAVILERVKEGK